MKLPRFKTGIVLRECKMGAKTVKNGMMAMMRGSEYNWKR